MKTILEVIQSTTEYFQRNGIDEARLNTELLLAHALDKKRMELYLEFDRPLSETELAPLREVVRKRAQGVPLQHLLGTVEFFGHTFKSDSRALIPRPETERFVELLTQKIKTSPAHIVDVGTGSGVIALSMAAFYTDAQVEAVDISSEALRLAKENAGQLGLSERVQFHEGDLLEPIHTKPDCIIANLPYIESGAIPSLSREVQHDPKLALDGGTDGLDLVRQLTEQCRKKLAGLLALEIGAGQHEAVHTLLTNAGFRDIEVLPDYQKVLRFVLGYYG